MLSKLYKHEFKALARTLWPVYLALLVMAVFNRISMLFEMEDVWFLEGLQGMLMATYVLGIVAVFIISLVIVVVRFYQHLMTSQGYLTFTLPVTPTNHIVCKLVCGTAAVVVSFVATILSLMILSIGTDIVPEVFRNIGLFVEEFAKISSAGNAALVVAGFILFLLLITMAGLLMFYTAIAIGQQFKNRIGGAVLSYIIIYMAMQVVGMFTAMPLVFNALGFSNTDFTISSVVGLINVMMGYGIVCSLLLCAAFFFVTRHMLTKKLNLE